MSGAYVVCVVHDGLGKRSTRDQWMNARSMSVEPAAAAVTGDRRRAAAAPAAADRRSVSVVERTSRGQASAAKPQLLHA